MITREAVREIHSNISGRSQQFTIAATGKAFRTLMDGLYTNKIESVVREISSNAADIHRKDKIKKDFVIKAPNMMEPTFSVRDFGSSMDEDFIMELYSTLFFSSKDTSNEEVGLFGLGSKSPFAYVDAFTVTTFRSGEQKTYACHIDSNDIPTVSLLSTRDTKEPDGTLVSFAVLQKDLTQFSTAIKRVCLGYPKPPTVLGIEIEIPKPVYNKYGIRAYDYNKLTQAGITFGTPYSKIGILLEQGNVLYPVPPGINGFNEFVAGGNTILKIISVPIGTFDVTPSREAVSVTDATRKSLDQFSRDLFEAIRIDISDVYKDCETRLDYCKARPVSNLFLPALTTHWYKTMDPALKLNNDQIVLTPDHYLLARLVKPTTPKIQKYGTPTGDELYYQGKEMAPGKLYRTSGKYYHGHASIKYPDARRMTLWVGLEREMPRRLARVKAICNTDKDSYFCFSEDLPRLMRILGLQARQVKSINNLPDIPVTSRPAAARKPSKGTQRGKFRDAKKMPSNDLYYIVERGKVPDGYNKIEEADYLNRIRALIDLYVTYVDKSLAAQWTDRNLIGVSQRLADQIEIAHPGRSVNKWIEDNVKLDKLDKYLSKKVCIDSGMTYDAQIAMTLRATNCKADPNLASLLSQGLRQTCRTHVNTLVTKDTDPVEIEAVERLFKLCKKILITDHQKLTSMLEAHKVRMGQYIASQATAFYASLPMITHGTSEDVVRLLLEWKPKKD